MAIAGHARTGEKITRKSRFFGSNPKPCTHEALIPIIISTSHACGTECMSVAINRGKRVTATVTVAAATKEISRNSKDTI